LAYAPDVVVAVVDRGGAQLTQPVLLGGAGDHALPVHVLGSSQIPGRPGASASRSVSQWVSVSNRGVPVPLIGVPDVRRRLQAENVMIFAVADQPEVPGRAC
jgi:hypothetical protein